MADREFVRPPIQAFESLLDLGGEGIEKLCHGLEQTGPTLMPWNQRAELIQQIVGPIGDLPRLQSILANAIDFIVFILVHEEKSPDFLLEVVGHVLRTSLKDGATVTKRSEQWSKLTPQLSRLFHLRTLRLEGKARLLLTSRPNRVLGLDLFTDARPVFDNDAMNIEATCIMNTLGIQFRDGTRIEQIYFSMDPEDVEALAGLLDRARKKNSTLLEKSRLEGITPLMVESSPANGANG